MGSLLVRFTQVALVALAVAGGWGTWGLLIKTGVADMIEKAKTTMPFLMEGSNAPLKRSITGIEVVDNQLMVMNLFFQPILTGHLPGLSLQSFYFGGQFGAAWALLAIESMREGNQGLIASYIAIWGFMMQNVAFAVIAPIYLILQLGTTPLTRSTHLSAILPSNPAEAFSLPIALFVGYVVPSILMALPPPFVDFDQKQILNAIWQPFPIWVSLLQQVFKRIGGSFIPKSLAVRSSGLRLAYGSALVLAGTTNVISLALSLSTLAFPTLFTPLARSQLHPWTVFFPSMWLEAKPLGSIGAGSALFLQHDEIVGTGAVLLWALTLAHTGTGSSFASAARLALVIPVLNLLFGPVGAAIGLLWIRDETVIAKALDSIEKKRV